MKVFMAVVLSLFSVNALTEGAYPLVRMKCEGTGTAPDGSTHTYLFHDVADRYSPYIQIIVDIRNKWNPRVDNLFLTTFDGPIDLDPKLIEVENGKLQLTKNENDDQWTLNFELTAEELYKINYDRPHYEDDEDGNRYYYDDPISTDLVGQWSGTLTCIDNRNLQQ